MGSSGPSLGAAADAAPPTSDVCEGCSGLGTCDARTRHSGQGKSSILQPRARQLFVRHVSCHTWPQTKAMLRSEPSSSKQMLQVISGHSHNPGDGIRRTTVSRRRNGRSHAEAAAATDLSYIDRRTCTGARYTNAQATNQAHKASAQLRANLNPKIPLPTTPPQALRHTSTLGACPSLVFDHSNASTCRCLEHAAAATATVKHRHGRSHDGKAAAQEGVHGHSHGNEEASNRPQPRRQGLSTIKSTLLQPWARRSITSQLLEGIKQRSQMPRVTTLGL